MDIATVEQKISGMWLSTSDKVHWSFLPTDELNVGELWIDIPSKGMGSDKEYKLIEDGEVKIVIDGKIRSISFPSLDELHLESEGKSPLILRRVNPIS